MARLRVVFTVFRLHLKQVAVNGLIIFAVVVQPIIVALLAIYLLRDTAGFQAIYVIVGSALGGLWTGILHSSSFNVQGERWSGTLEAIIGSPTQLNTIVIGKTLADTAMSVSSILISYPMAAMLFGYPLRIAHPFLFVVSVFLAVLAFLSLGLLIAPFMSIIIGSTVWVNMLEMPVYILGGFLFPISLLPDWTTPFSYGLAPYWAAQALHTTSSGGLTVSNLLLSWGLLVAFCVCYLLISRWLFGILLRRARGKATLGVQ